MMSMLSQLTWLDGIALFFFVLCWHGYGFVTDRNEGLGGRGLIQKTHQYRVLWAKELIKRSNRVPDTALIGYLVRSVSFYANTTIYIIAGVFALLGTMDRLINVTEGLPFSRDVSPGLLEIKVLLILTVFVIAYFKFTWSLRQFSLLSIMVGGAPEAGKDDEAMVQSYTEKLAKISTLAGDEFNRGLRAYYFGIASVTWTIHPGLLMTFSAIIVAVLAQRDFKSAAVRALSD